MPYSKHKLFCAFLAYSHCYFFTLNHAGNNQLIGTISQTSPPTYYATSEETYGATSKVSEPESEPASLSEIEV